MPEHYRFYGIVIFSIRNCADSLLSLDFINQIKKIPVLLVFLYLTACTDDVKKAPLPENGVLNLTDWNFRDHGGAILVGYWEYYYGDFLTSRQFDTIRQKSYAWSPGVWKRDYVTSTGKAIKEKVSVSSNDYKINRFWNEEKPGPTGFASYHLTILLPAQSDKLGIKLKDQGTAYKFFVNDSLVAKSGEPGKSPESSVPSYLHHTIIIDKPGDTLNLTFWISNFHYRKGGLWKAVVIGSPDKIIRQISNNFSFLQFIAGIWFMVCFILICFYIYRPKEKGILFLFLWALCTLVRLVTADDRAILQYYPDINFDLFIKMELLSGFGMVPFCIMAMHRLFPHEFSRLFNNTMVFAYSLLFCIVVITKPLFYSNLVIPYQFIDIIALAFSSYYLIKAMIHKREGAVIIGIGITLVLFLYIIQILYYNQLAYKQVNATSMSIGFIVAFAQVTLLARTFSSALHKVENFAGELESTVQERTSELIKAQEELIKAARHTETEKVRRRISQDIHDDISSGLNKISWMSELVKIKAQRNKPDELNIIIDKIIKSSRETVDNLIEIIWSLNPNNDDLENMLAYMRNYTNKFFDDTSFNVTINFPEHLERKIEINPELKRNLFLVMKEALHNSAKYSHAEHVVLNFNLINQYYNFTISDDGVGIHESVIQGSGNGMINMRKRMKDIQGSLMIESAQGKGTSIILEGPIY